MFLGHLLNARWLRYTGKISYGLYLIHMPIFLFFTATARRHAVFSNSPGLNNIVNAAVEILAVFIVAAVSWRFLETPILRLKSHFTASSV